MPPYVPYVGGVKPDLTPYVCHTVEVNESSAEVNECSSKFARKPVRFLSGSHETNPVHRESYTVHPELDPEYRDLHTERPFLIRLTGISNML